MAISWGSYKSVGGPVNFRAGIDITYSPTTVTASTTSVTVTTRVYLGASGSAFASGGSYSVSGSDSGSGSQVSWSISGSGGSDLIATLTETVTLNVGSTKSFTINATIRPSGSWPGSVSHSRTITLPARPGNPPAPVGSLSVARVSDSRQNLTWTVSSTSTAPVSSVEIRRMDQVKSYVTIAQPTGAVTSYADRSTTSNRHYRYAVRTRNSAGASDWRYVEIDTTPSVPGAPSVKRLPSGSILITHNSMSDMASHWEVYVATGVPNWSTATLIAAVPVGTLTYEYVSPDPGLDHTFALRARSASPVLRSALSAPSRTINIIAAPYAPTITAPDAADVTDEITLFWEHNPSDTTDQTAYEIRWRFPGGAWTNIYESGETTAHTLLPDEVAMWENGNTIEWQVRTWGAHIDASPWSTVATLQLSAKPVVGIELPDVYDSNQLVVPWTYHDPEGSAQSWWQVQLVDPATNEPVETRYGNGPATSATMRTRLPNFSTWVVWVTVADGLGITGITSHSLTVDYALPPVPSGVATWHKDDGYVTMTVDVPNPVGDEVLADHLQVWRGDEDGLWVLVADDLQAGDTIVDNRVPTGVAVTYRVASVSTLPSTAYSADIVLETRTKWVFFNWGPDFGNVARVYGNVQVSRSASRSKVLHELAGREYPVERGGGRRTRTYQVSGTLFAPWLPSDPTSAWEDFEELAFAPAPVLVRDPEGTRLFCSVGDVDLSDASSAHRRVSVPLTVVDWSEDGVSL